MEAKQPKVTIKDYTSETGNKYKFQKVKPSKWLEIIDKTMDANGNRNRSKFYPEILENVVVQPSSMKIDDFDGEEFGGFSELDEVVAEATRFQSGK